MKLCVFEADLTPEPLLGAHGSYPQMIERWLAPHLPAAAFSSVSVIQGEALPEPAAFDGYVITGSGHGVYDQLPWMGALAIFLQAVREIRRPVFGICFGHQLMAEAYGGKVQKSEQGWRVGAQAYRYNEDSGLASGPSLAFHQDQVMQLPDCARRIGSNAHCPIAAIEYEFPALSVQYHPEFDEPFVTALLNMYQGELLSEEVTQAARASMAHGPVDNARVADWVAAFFRRANSGGWPQGLSTMDGADDC